VVLTAAINAGLARADAHLAKARYGQAEREYEAVLRRDPTNSRAREGLSNLRRIESQRLFDSGKTAYDEAQYEQALTIFEGILRQDPRNAEAKRYLALTREALKPVVDAYFRAGLQHYLVERYEEALNEWKKALRIDPENDAILGYARRAEEKIKALEELK
jgi:tetratricopeptide (TPR) repeat protein